MDVISYVYGGVRVVANNMLETVVYTILAVGALVVIWKWVVPEIRKNVILAVRGEI